MRLSIVLAAVLLAQTAFAAEEADVLFFAPFEDGADAASAQGDPKAHITGKELYAPGVRGQAVKLDADALLTFAFKGNVLTDEGTIMMWLKPEWRTDDGRFHHFFRASTGNHKGKALNAVMLYKYLRDERLLFYTSNGAPTETHEGRTIAIRDRLDWQTVLSYFALNYTQTGTPDYVNAEREWRRNPYSESTFDQKSSYASVCNASTWADFLVWAAARTMDETGTDGIYLDCSNPNFCRSGEHGCAPGRYPLLATRELQKRLYAMIRQKRRDKGFVYNHNSESNILTTFSFSDAVLNGEQYNRKDLRALTFDKLRAELSPQPYGVPAFLLPTLVKFQQDKKEKMPGAEFLAFPLLHDVICNPSWLSRDSQKLLQKIQAVLREFGVADAEFLPYWDNKADISPSPAGAVVSAYVRSDGKAALLVAQGGQEPATFELVLGGRLAALRGAPARDALSNEPLTWNDGKLRWTALDRKVQLVILGRAQDAKE